MDLDPKLQEKTKVLSKIGVGGLSRKHNGGLFTRFASYYTCFPAGYWNYATMVLVTGNTKATAMLIDDEEDDDDTIVEITEPVVLTGKDADDLVKSDKFLLQVEETIFELLRKYEFKTEYLTRTRGHYSWVKDCPITTIRNAFKKVRDRHPKRLVLVYPASDAFIEKKAKTKEPKKKPKKRRRR